MSFNVVSGDLHDLESKRSKHAAKYTHDANQMHTIKPV